MPTRPAVNGRLVGIALVVLAAGGGVEALTDLVGATAYRPGLGWLGLLGQLAQLGGAAACIFGGWLMYASGSTGKPPAIYGLATALIGQVVVLIAGSSLADTAIVVVLLVFAYYVVVISQFPAAGVAPAPTVGAVIIALVLAAALDWVLVSIQTSSGVAPGSAGVITLTGENRITVMKLHNDASTPCGSAPFKGTPPFTLSFVDNTKKLTLTVMVNSGSGPSFMLGDPTAGARASLSASGYNETATSGQVDLISNKIGTFVLHFPPPPPNTTPSAPFVTGFQLTVSGTFSCG